MPRDVEEKGLDRQAPADDDGTRGVNGSVQTYTAEGHPLDLDVKPDGDFRMEVKRTELDQRIDADETGGRDSSGVESGVQVRAELQRVRGHGEIRVGAQGDAGNGHLEMHADRRKRGQLRRSRIKARIEATDRKHRVSRCSV